MKLTSRKNVKASNTEIKAPGTPSRIELEKVRGVPPVQIKPQEKEMPAREVVQIPTETSEKGFSDRESLQKAAVFTSGWQAKVPRDTIEIRKEEPVKRLTGTPRMRGNKKSVRKSIVFLFMFSILLAVLYHGAMYFERTTVVIQEKHEELVLDATEFIASKNTDTDISFEIMIVTDSDAKNIVLTETEDAKRNATGTVTLYNEFSTTPVTIAPRSHLADANGKTYLTDTKVTIPGYKTSGTQIIPGTVDVRITAFLPGDAYNSTSTDFTISAYKGTTKFKKIYAKAVQPIKGGAQGLAYILGATEKGNVSATAQSTFKSRLIKKVNAEVPKGYILYPDAFTFTYTVDEAVRSSTPEATVGITGTLAAIIFKESDLEDALIKNKLSSIGTIERKEIDIPEIAKLKFSFLNENQIITKDMHTVAFNLTGKATAIWHPDIENFKARIVGVSKDMLPSLFKTDPGIAEARATLFPPWQKSLPTDISKIHVTAL